MPLLDRLRLTLRADAHGVIDALEDRALMLKQHLRDAELEVHKKRTRLSDLASEETRLGVDEQRVVTEQAQHDRDAELALAEGCDDLARKALSRALPLGQLLRRIRERAEQNRREQRELAVVLAAQETDLSALRARVEAFLAAEHAVHSEGRAFVPLPVSDDQVEIELLRRKRAQREPTSPVAAAVEARDAAREQSQEGSS
jgi:phage shock protein A